MYTTTSNGAQIIGILTILLSASLCFCHAQNTWMQKTDFGGVARYAATGFSVDASTNEWTTIQSNDNDKTLSGLVPATEYKWQVKTICVTGPIISSDWSVKETFITDPLKSGTSPDEMVFDIYPNPLTSSTTISFSLQQDSQVQLELYDVAGKKLRTLLDKNISAGNHEANLNRDQLMDGIYFIRLLIDDEVIMKKVLVE